MDKQERSTVQQLQCLLSWQELSRRGCYAADTTCFASKLRPLAVPLLMSAVQIDCFSPVVSVRENPWYTMFGIHFPAAFFSVLWRFLLLPLKTPKSANKCRRNYMYQNNIPRFLFDSGRISLESQSKNCQGRPEARQAVHSLHKSSS